MVQPGVSLVNQLIPLQPDVSLANQLTTVPKLDVFINMEDDADVDLIIIKTTLYIARFNLI